MLIIRQKQMESFRRDRLLQFRRLLIQDLGAALTNAGISWAPAEIERQADLGAAYAENAGFSRECDAARFTILICRHLGGFTEAPLPKAVFDIGRAFGSAPEVRLQRLEAWLMHCRERQSYAR